MLKRVLGRTGLEVTSVGLGCYQFTGEFGVSPDEAMSIINYAMDSGINYYDTAEEYGFGESEEIVGRGLYNHRNKKFVVSSKVGYFLKSTELNDVSVTRKLNEAAFVNPMEIKRAIKHSLWLLRLDHLDIMMIHEYNSPLWGIDHKTGNGIVVSVLEELKKEGVVSGIGLGGWNPKIAVQLLSTGRFDMALIAGGMSLLSRPVFDEVIPEAKKQNAGIVLGGCFGQNNLLLINKDRKILQKIRATGVPKLVEIAEKLEKLYDLSDELGISLTEMAIRYILSFEDVHSHVPGAREIRHIKDNLKAANAGPLEKEYVEAINKIQSTGEPPTAEDLSALRNMLYQ